MVTPTRVLPCPPEMETSNRVLRHFHEHVDCFIRVQFTDEDGSRFMIDEGSLNAHNNVCI